LTPTRSTRSLLHQSSLRRSSSPHRIAHCPSPFHHRPRASRTSPPITPIASCSSLQVSRRRARPRSPFVSLTRASFLAIDSRLASIRLVPYQLDSVISLYLLGFPPDRPLRSSSSFPFHLLVFFSLLVSISSDTTTILYYDNFEYNVPYRTLRATPYSTYHARCLLLTSLVSVFCLTACT